VDKYVIDIYQGISHNIYLMKIVQVEARLSRNPKRLAGVLKQNRGMTEKQLSPTTWEEIAAQLLGEIQ
jgi:hypothetical protein